MKTNLVLFLVAALILSAISISSMLNTSNSADVASQCRIQSDITPANFDAIILPDESKDSEICGIFGDVKPMDWDDWFEDNDTTTLETITSNPVCGIFGDVKPMDWDDWFEGNDPTNG